MDNLDGLIDALPEMTGYCASAPGHPFHGPYHASEYGFRVVDDAVIFERLTLEVFQAGLSWLLCLQKRDGFRTAFADFDVGAVAAYSKSHVGALLENQGIIRHRAKIEATIHNARALSEIICEAGSIAEWLDRHHPASLSEWQIILKARFKFIGPEVAREFLASLGYLPDAHGTNCPVFRTCIDSGALWASQPSSCLTDHFKNRR